MQYTWRPSRDGGNKYFITFIHVHNIPVGDGGLGGIGGMSTSETYLKSRTPRVRGAPHENT